MVSQDVHAQGLRLGVAGLGFFALAVGVGLGLAALGAKTIRALDGSIRRETDAPRPIHAFAFTFAHTCTCGSPRKYQTIAGPSICHTSQTPSWPMSMFL